MGATYQPPQWLVPNMGPGNVNKVGNYSFNFDGGFDYIYTGYTGAVTSCSLWFKPDATITTVGGFSALMGFEDSGNYAGIYLGGNVVGAISDELITIFTTGSQNKSYYSQVGGTINTDWHHLVISHNGTQYNIYLDNINVFTANQYGTPPVISATRFDIGARIKLGVIDSPFAGLIDEVAVFDYELTADNVAYLWGNTNDGVGNPMGFASPPVAYYKGDRAGFGDEWAVPNQVNYDQVFDFDGSGYVTVTPTAFTDFTVSFWINPSTSVAASHDGILGQGTTAAQGGILKYIVYNGSGSVGNVLAYIGVWTDVSGTVTNGVWTNIILTYDSTANELKGYNNGSLYTTISSPDFSAQTTAAHSFVDIGRRNHTSATIFYGEISNVALWDSASINIDNIYNNGTPQSTYTVTPNSWWKLDSSATFDPVTTTWSIPDAGSGSNTGTSTGMTQASLVPAILDRSSSDSNYSFLFDGIDDYIDIIDSAVAPAIFQDIGDNNSYSISAWIKTTGGTGIPTEWRPDATVLELREESAAADTKVPFSFGVASDKICIGRTADYVTNPETVLSTTSVNDGDWHHIAVVIVDDAYTFYLDGVPDGTGTFASATGDCSVGGIIDSNMQIGVRARDGGDKDVNPFDGNISNPALWSSELSAADMDAIWNNGKPGDLTSLSPIVWWKLGNDAFAEAADAATATGWIIPDQIGSNDGTSEGNPTISGDAPESTANGLSVSMDLEDRIGESGFSDSNAQSYNMPEDTRKAYT